MFGLLEKDMDYITSALKRFKEIEKAYIFGSRALGNYKPGSDVDIAISGENISAKTIYELSELLNEEYPLPYFFDIVHYEKITNENLLEHINSCSKQVFGYERNTYKEIDN